MPTFTLESLQETIRQRSGADAEQSWTASLFTAGVEKAAQKLGEEAVETVIAAIRGDRKALIGESADLVYHWLVVLEMSGVSLSDVMMELERRTGQSGAAEKAGRLRTRSD